jgi:hypothetical protein
MEKPCVWSSTGSADEAQAEQRLIARLTPPCAYTSLGLQAPPMSDKALSLQLLTADASYHQVLEPASRHMNSRQAKLSME